MGKLLRSWHEFKEGRPGRRFQDAARRNAASRSKHGLLYRCVRPLLGILLLLIGVFLCVVPGPGIPFILLGLSILSGSSKTIARFLDWSELKLRALINWLKRWWHHSPQAGKVAAVLLVCAIATGLCYGAYFLVFVRGS